MGREVKMRKISVFILSIVMALSILGSTSCTSNEEVSELTVVLNTQTLEPPEFTAETKSTPTETSPAFLIQAEENLRPGVTALYQAFFDGVSPVFVESGADLVAKTWVLHSDHPVVEPTFLWGRVLLSQNDLPIVNEFIDFAISIEGQKVLDEKGLLVLANGLTDQTQNNVLFSQPVKRVISAYGPSTAFVYTVNAKDRLVSASYLGARDPLGQSVMAKMDERFPEIMGDDNFSQDNFNIEQAASLDPDLIIASSRSAWLDSAAQLEIPVFLYDAETPELLKEAVLSTGIMFGPQSNAYAEAWVAYYDGIIHNIQRKTVDIPDEDRVRVLFTGTSPLRVASGEMYQDFVIRAAGGVSVSSSLTGYWNDVNLEQIAIWDPDVIIVPPYGGATIDAIIESPEWQILDAVQAGRVYRMPKLVAPWDTPVPDSVLGIIWMAELLYPDLIDLDCAEEVEYFYHTFYQYQITQEELEMVCQSNE
jgi:iron complex transport system substrate-binding protein